MNALLPHYGYPILTANLPNPTCLVNFSRRFPITIKSPIIPSSVFHSEGIKIIPQTSKNSRGIPDINEKVKLAIKRQQLARNMKKIGEKSKKI